MNSKKENYLNINSELNENMYTQISSKISNSAISLKNNNIFINYIPQSSNLNNSIQPLKLINNSQLSSTQLIEKKSDSNVNNPELLNKTSSFAQNDINYNKQNSMISEEYGKVNSIHDKITFQKQDTNNKINNSQVSYRIKLEDRSIDSYDKNKILLSPKSIPIYTQILLLKLFNEYLKNEKPIIYAQKTENKKIMGFAALNYDNNHKNKNKMSIDINIVDENKNDSINYFSMYRKDIQLKILYYLMSLNVYEQSIFLQQYDKEIFTIIIQKGYITILNNAKKKNHFISILSSNNSLNIKILKCQHIYEYNNNFDYIILINNGIYKNILCLEINKIIYETLKYIIEEGKTFENFLGEVIININKKVIENGGKSSMSIIFICLETIFSIFENKDLSKIEEILNTLSKTYYDIDDENKDNLSKISSNKINTPISYKDEVNLTFRMKNTIDNLSNNSKKISIFKCCGI